MLSIVAHYDTRKHRFEALAELVTANILRESGSEYRTGWITPPSSDGGADFVGRIDLGSGFARTNLVLLGQAKCVPLSTAAGGLHLARVVARLRRGWVGAFATTGHFSAAAQRDVIEDAYPLLLINGREIAESVDRMMHSAGVTSLNEFLAEIDATYEHRVSGREPESILLDE